MTSICHKPTGVCFLVYVYERGLTSYVAKPSYFVDNSTTVQTALTSNINVRTASSVSELLLDASDANFKNKLMDAAGKKIYWQQSLFQPLPA